MSWTAPHTVSSVSASFIVDANDQLPAAITVSYWNGSSWVPVTGQHVRSAGASNAPSSITFDGVSTTALKLDMTSATPNDPVSGNLAISEVQVPGVTS